MDISKVPHFSHPVDYANYKMQVLAKKSQDQHHPVSLVAL